MDTNTSAACILTGFAIIFTLDHILPKTSDVACFVVRHQSGKVQLFVLFPHQIDDLWQKIYKQNYDAIYWQSYRHKCPKSHVIVNQQTDQSSYGCKNGKANGG